MQSYILKIDRNNKYLKIKGKKFLLSDVAKSNINKFTKRKALAVRAPDLNPTNIITQIENGLIFEVDFPNLAKLRNTISAWSSDGQKESLGSFYYTSNQIKEIQNSKRWIILGHKGQGKSALANRLEELQNNNPVVRMSFKSVDMKTISKHNNNGLKWKTFWQEIITEELTKSLIKNTLTVREDTYFTKIKKIINSADQLTILSESLNKIIDGDALTKEHSDESYSRFLTHIKKNISANFPKNITLIIDNIDQGAERNSEHDNYLSGIFYLMEVIDNLHLDLKNLGINLKPYLFLRKDLFYAIDNPNHSHRINDTVELTWSGEELLKLFTTRIFGSMLATKFEGLLYLLSSNPNDSADPSEFDVFELIQNESIISTPRDIVLLAKYCALYSQQIGDNDLFSASVVDMALQDCSRIWRMELVETLYFHLIEPEMLIEGLFDKTESRLILKEDLIKLIENSKPRRSSNFTLSLLLELKIITIETRGSTVAALLSKSTSLGKEKYRISFKI